MDTFYTKKNNTAPTLQQTLLDPNGEAVDLTGASVRFHVNDRYGVSVIDAAATISNETGGIVQYTFSEVLQGNYQFEFKVTYSGGAVETFPNSGFDILIAERGLA